VSAGKDRALDAARDWSEEMTLGARVAAALRRETGTRTEALAMIRNFQTERQSMYTDVEAELYRASARMADDGDMSVALAILQCAADVFPSSAMARDHRPELHLRSGNVPKAISEFEIALAIDSKGLDAGSSFMAAVCIGACSSFFRRLRRARLSIPSQRWSTCGLCSSGITVVGQRFGMPLQIAAPIGAGLCITVRLLALHYGWRLPVARPTT
jgi:tetratricopeptide (TPR) repeat protein